MPDLVLIEPDIAPNAGALMRLCACLGIGLHIVEPAGFVMTDRKLRRAGMDYIDQAALTRHVDLAAFLAFAGAHNRRLVAVETGTALRYTAFAFRSDDLLLFGVEGSGLPDRAIAAADVAVTIPMRPGMRSLNVALAAAMVIGEAVRQVSR
jgi:tRNA (cytidine/uridine-2'-O-)-methyltransferase